LPGLAARSALGGALMGLANLVPGISGGTMLLAAGIYPQFIKAVAEVTRLRLDRRSLLILGVVCVAAVVVVGGLAGIVGRLVVDHTWVMYSLFIGLTLGGVPLVWQMAPGRTKSFWIGVAVGVLAMVALVLIQILGVGTGGGGGEGYLIMGIAGLLGASAMVLPGLSGGYLLLLLGVYVTILESIEQLFLAARAFDYMAAAEPIFKVVLPVGIGVILGIVGVSNLVKLVLEKFPRPTLGLLLGLLLGALAGLWPFHRGVEPELGTLLKGQTVIEVDGQLVLDRTGRPVGRSDYPRQFFTPSPSQMAGAAGLAILGFWITASVARFGQEKKPRR